MATISSSRRKCKLDPNVFCYICSSFTVSKQRQGITDFVKKAYLAYFGVKLGDQDKNWAPHPVCRTCVENLRQWTKQKRKTIGFAVPMVWKEEANHVDNCYFCKTNVAGFSSKSKGNIKYPNLTSAIQPVTHSADLPPLFTSLPEVGYEPVSSTSEESSIEDDCYEPLPDTKSPILVTQAFLNDLVRDFNLPKDSAELLGSRLQHNIFLVQAKRKRFGTILFHGGNICALSQCCWSSSSNGLYIRPNRMATFY